MLCVCVCMYVCVHVCVCVRIHVHACGIGEVKREESCVISSAGQEGQLSSSITLS